ncbi:DNA-binding response regulator, LytR/AlgR family [Pedobacter terrae]|uniref:DNA-binding response regulator, LytR/AlgR family n=1 Tax=Pedobacter terrae TaxID=405671 RepID=A0A1G8CL74_9SPHI|nr:LytTR family DNA-binding domain-containing protein [Pedobacter terrae]SDH46281.1 DNA-binding response regulator, LytR/AlgR family [Pedobacter terrae]
MYKCVIIDDELHAVEYLENYISRLPNFEITGSYTDPLKALTDILEGPSVDLILMDVDMPEISGIELSKAIRKKTSKLVFTTSHTKYGFDAFEVEADGYILKPYNFAKFMQVINRLFIEPKQLEKSSENRRFFFVRTSKANNMKIVKVFFNEIIAIESNLNYVQIHTCQGSVETYMSLTELDLQLNQVPDLVRFQRSFIVNKSRIDNIEGNIIRMDNGLKISVGNYYKKSFDDFISKNLIKSNKRG